jgi:hypothetical protein
MSITTSITMSITMSITTNIIMSITTSIIMSTGCTDSWESLWQQWYCL